MFCSSSKEIKKSLDNISAQIKQADYSKDLNEITNELKKIEYAIFDSNKKDNKIKKDILRSSTITYNIVYISVTLITILSIIGGALIQLYYLKSIDALDLFYENQSVNSFIMFSLAGFFYLLTITFPILFTIGTGVLIETLFQKATKFSMFIHSWVVLSIIGIPLLYFFDRIMYFLTVIVIIDILIAICIYCKTKESISIYYVAIRIVIHTIPFTILLFIGKPIEEIDNISFFKSYIIISIITVLGYLFAVISKKNIKPLQNIFVSFIFTISIAMISITSPLLDTNLIIPTLKTLGIIDVYNKGYLIDKEFIIKKLKVPCKNMEEINNEDFILTKGKIIWKDDKYYLFVRETADSKEHFRIPKKHLEKYQGKIPLDNNYKICKLPMSQKINMMSIIEKLIILFKI